MTARGIGRAVAAITAVASVGLVAPAASTAVTPLGTSTGTSPHRGAVVSPIPIATTPHVVGDVSNNERVRDLVEIGSLVIAVGRFTEVREPGGDVLSRPYAFAFDVETGAIDERFAPVFDGEVHAVAVTPDGGILFGGEFEFVDGYRSRHLVKLDRDGNVMTEFRAIPNRDVLQIEVVGDTAYLGGRFFRVDGEPRELIAAVDATTGELGPLSLDFEEPREVIQINPELIVRAMDVSPDGTTMVIGGGFNRIDDQRRSYLAVIDLANEQLSPWYSSAYEAECRGRRQPTPIWDVAISPDGTYFVVVTTGFTGAEPGSGALCDVAARFELDSSAPDVAPTWLDWTNGDSLTEVEITDDAVYVGGHMRWVNGLDVTIGDRSENVDRAGLAALDPRSGVPLRWRADRQPRGAGVWELLATDRGLWVASDTDFVSGEFRGKLALLPLEGGVSLPTSSPPTLPVALGVPSSGPAATGGIIDFGFDGTVPVEHGVVADSVGRVGGVGAATMVGSTLIFTRRDTHVLAARDFDGDRLEDPRRLDPLGLGPAEWPLRSIRGLFFDHALNRLYYAIDGIDTLYYRGFAPESELIGPAETIADESTLAWGSIRGMELIDGRLHVGGTDGVLRSYVVDADLVPDVGTEMIHGGPGVDGRSWDGSFFAHPPPGPGSGAPGQDDRLTAPRARLVVDTGTEGELVELPVELTAGDDLIVAVSLDDATADARVFVTGPDGETAAVDRSTASARALRLRAAQTGRYSVSVRMVTGRSRVRIAVEPTRADLPTLVPNLVARWSAAGDDDVRRWQYFDAELDAGLEVTVGLEWLDADASLSAYLYDTDGELIWSDRDGAGQTSTSFVPAVAGKYRLTVVVDDGATDFYVSMHRANIAPALLGGETVDAPADVVVTHPLVPIDLDGDTLQFTASGIPPGISVTADGTLVGSVAGIGTWDGAVTAADAYGGSTTMPIRWISRLPSHRIEHGLVELANDSSGNWTPVSFAEPFAFTPVVIAGPPSYHDDAPALVRVRNVTTTGFEMMIQEWAGRLRWHLAEDVAWLAALPGNHDLGGLTIKAGWFETDQNHDHVAFEVPFASKPVVLSTVQSEVQRPQVTTRLSHVGEAGFDVRLSSADSREQQRPEEVVGFVAIEVGSIETEGVTVSAGNVTLSDIPVALEPANTEGPPQLFAMIQSDDGTDNATIRYRRSEGSAPEIWIEEETTFDEEVHHKFEDVGWVVISGVGRAAGW